EFDRGIDPSSVPPDRDQEGHRNQHQLPGEIKEEEIDGEKDADNPGENPEEIEVEKSDPLLNLVPGGEDRQDTKEKGEDDQEEAQAVHREMKLDSEPWNPGEADFFEPGDRPIGRERHHPSGVPSPEDDRENKPDPHGDQGNPAGAVFPVAGGRRAEQAAGQRNKNQPNQNHKSTTHPRKKIVPAATPAAYHRIRPVSVLRSASSKSAARRAMPVKTASTTSKRPAANNERTGRTSHRS